MVSVFNNLMWPLTQNSAIIKLIILKFNDGEGMGNWLGTILNQFQMKLLIIFDNLGDRQHRAG